MDELQGKLSEDDNKSRDYSDFMSEYRHPEMNLYEKACKFSEFAGLTPDVETAKKIEAAASFSKLQVTPKGVYSFAFVAPLIFVTIFGFLAYILLSGDFVVTVIVVLSGLSAIYPLMQIPFNVADNYRLKASNQMVLSIFYLVTYMRHTSNLERAIGFAAEHLAPPLSDDFRKVLWDVESGKYDNINESIENFLLIWKVSNPEFVDAMHLISSSLMEGNEERRIEALDKALNLILDETYEKMLHYAHNLQSPITTLNMMGIILPILGMVMLPLMVAFLDGVKWYHIAIIYDVVLPIGVFLFGLKILSKRPSGYGETSITGKEVQEAMNAKVKFGKIQTNLTPFILGMTILCLLVLIGLIPIVMYSMGVTDFGFGEVIDGGCGKSLCFLEYRTNDAGITSGPFGLPSSLMSLFITLGVGVGLGIYFKYRSREVVKIFDKSKSLEREFSSALFQLGSRLGDNLPAEVAAIKVSESLPDTDSGNFFRIITINIQKLGLSLKDAIYSPTVGAILYYPSSIIESSMSVLIQSAKKGPAIAANAILNLSRYIKEMHKVEERLTDLMAEVISSMKSQVSFLMPVIAAVVVSLTSMIGSILGLLGSKVGGLMNNVGEQGQSLPMGSMLAMFKNSIPTFYLQLIIGIYVVEITLIITIIINIIKNGSDNVHRDEMLGNNLIKSTELYVVISAVLMLVFYFVIKNIIPATGV